MRISLSFFITLLNVFQLCQRYDTESQRWQSWSVLRGGLSPTGHFRRLPQMHRHRLAGHHTSLFHRFAGCN